MPIITPIEQELYSIVNESDDAKFLQGEITRIATRLLKSSGEYHELFHKIQPCVTDEKNINAWIIPDINGITPLGLSNSILDRLETEDALAIAIGHELGHLKFQLEFGHRPNGKAQEAMADAYGIDYVVKAGYDPREAKAVFGRFPELFNLSQIARAAYTDVHTLKTERLQQLSTHIGSLARDYDLSSRKPTPISLDIKQAAQHVHHTSFIQAKLEAANFNNSDTPGKLRIMARLIESEFRNSADELFNKRFDDFTQVLNNNFADFNTNNPEHVAAFNEFLESFTLQAPCTRKFTEQKKRLYSHAQTIWNYNKNPADKYIGFQADIAGAFANFINAKNIDEALTAAKTLRAYTEKYEFNNPDYSPFGSGPKNEFAQKYPHFELPTKELAINSLKIEGSIKTPYANHLRWLVESKSGDIYYCLKLNGVEPQKINEKLYSLNWEFNAYNSPSHSITLPFGREDNLEFIENNPAGFTTSQNPPEAFEYSSDGTFITAVAAPEKYPRLSAANTPRLTEERLLESEQRRLFEVNRKQQEMITRADWDLFTSRPFKFAERYWEYLAPELSVIPNGGEVFAAEFTRRLNEKIAEGSEQHINFAKAFFTTKSTGKKLTAEEWENETAFKFSDFINSPVEFINSDAKFYLARNSANSLSKFADNFQKQFQRFYNNEFFPGSLGRQELVGTPIHKFLTDMEAELFANYFEENYTRQKRNLKHYTDQISTDKPASDNGWLKGLIENITQSLADADKLIEKYKQNPQTFLDEGIGKARFLFDGPQFNITSDYDLLFRISNYLEPYLEAEIWSYGLPVYEDKYLQANSEIHVPLHYGTSNYGNKNRGQLNSSNPFMHYLPFEVSINHPYQKFMRLEQPELFTLGQRASAMGRSYYYAPKHFTQDIEISWRSPLKKLPADLPPEKRWLYGEPSHFLGYKQPQNIAEVLSLFHNLDLGVAKHLPKLAAKDITGKIAAGDISDDDYKNLNREILLSIESVEEFDKQEAKRILQYEVLRFLENHKGPIPFKDFREIINLAKLGDLFSEELNAAISAQVEINRQAMMGKTIPLDELMEIYREYTLSGIISNNLALQQEMESSIIAQAGKLSDTEKKLAIAQELIYSSNRDVINEITQLPNPDIIVTSNAAIRTIRAMEYAAVKGVVPNPKLKEWAIETMAEIEAAKLGPDNDSPIYYAKGKATIDRLKDNILTSENSNKVTYRIIEKVTAQKPLAYYVRDRAREFSRSANSIADQGITHYSILHSTITEVESLRKDTVKFLTSPLSEKSAAELLDNNYNYLAEAFKSMARKPDGEQKLTNENINRFSTRESKINALMQYHNNFWDRSFEFRTALISAYLFPINMLNEAQKISFSAKALNQACIRLTGQPYPETLKEIESKYNYGSSRDDMIYKIMKMAGVSGNEVEEVINHEFTKLRDEFRWSQVGNIENEIIDKCLGTSYERKTAEQICRAYLSIAEPDYKLLVLSSMMVASYPDGKEHQAISTGKMLDIVLGSFEEVGDKVKQAIHSNPSTPENIAVELSESKTGTRKPNRTEQVEFIHRYGPPQTGSENDICTIGKLLGSGSYGITVEVVKYNGEKTAVTILRPNSPQRSKAKFSEFRKAAELLAVQNPGLRPVISIIDQAANMAEPETDMDIAAKQSAQAAENFNYTKVKVDAEHEFKYQTVRWKGYGISYGHHGEIISGYKETQIAPGKHFNELPSRQDVKQAERDQANGKITKAAYEGILKQHKLKKAVAKSNLAVGLSHILSGHAFDHDLHGGQFKIDGHIIYKFDDGAVGPIKNREIITPTPEMKKALGEVFIRSLVESAYREKISTSASSWLGAMFSAAATISGDHSEIDFENEQYDSNISRNLQSARQKAVEAGKDADLVEINDNYKGFETRGLQSKIAGNISPGPATIMARKIENYKASPEVKEYLLSVQRGMLALGDYFKELDADEVKHVLGSVLSDVNIDPVIKQNSKGATFSLGEKGELKVLGKVVDLLQGKPPLIIEQDNPKRDKGIDYSATKTEPSEFQKNYDQLKMEEKIDKAKERDKPSYKRTPIMQTALKAENISGNTRHIAVERSRSHKTSEILARGQKKINISPKQQPANFTDRARPPQPKVDPEQHGR